MWPRVNRRIGVPWPASGFPGNSRDGACSPSGHYGMRHATANKNPLLGMKGRPGFRVVAVRPVRYDMALFFR